MTKDKDSAECTAYPSTPFSAKPKGHSTPTQSISDIFFVDMFM